MASKTLKTRIKLKYDTLANWQADGADVVLLKGEVAICEVPTGSSLEQTTPPAILFKVGDGVKTFAQLPWVSGLAADVYAWAKAATKPKYTASEVGAAPTNHNHTTSAITDFTNAVNGLIDAKIEEIPTVKVPEYTLETGTDEGSVVLKKDGVAVGDDVIIQGYSALKSSIAAKYTKPSSGIPKTDLASDVQASLGKADTALQAGALTGYATTSSVTSAINAHNTLSTAHSDIRTLISTLSGRVDGLGNALHFVGAGASASRPSTGKDGDVYVDTDDGKEYVWANKKWNEFGSGDHITKSQADGYYDAKGTASGLIGGLTASISNTAGKTITGLTQTNGIISATFSNISITQAQVSGLTDKLGTFVTTSALNSKITSLDKADAAVSNQYVTAVSETDGVISVTRKQISYNELSDKPSIATPGAGKLLDAAGTEIFNANQTTNDTIICIDCGSATELVD